jgi:glutathione peroxidase
METTMTIYDFSAVTSGGAERHFADYRGKVLLIVNVASKCGLTPQYKGLQALYERFEQRGLEILAFPCDQFGHQEPSSDAEISAFCDRTYGVTFPLFAKIEVNGQNAHSLYAWLKQQKGGLLGDRGSVILGVVIIAMLWTGIGLKYRRCPRRPAVRGACQQELRDGVRGERAALPRRDRQGVAVSEADRRDA